MKVSASEQEGVGSDVRAKGKELKVSSVRVNSSKLKVAVCLVVGAG